MLSHEKKKDKIVEAYLDLAVAIQNAGGCVSLIKDFKDRPLNDFMEEVSATNNVRFYHDKKGS